jgi:hypothetical protein
MKTIKVIISIFIILFFIEIILRIIKPNALEFYRLQKQFHAYNDEYLVDLEPLIDIRLVHFQGIFDIHFSTNEMGFRGTDRVNNSLPQIGCVGDSVTMGFGVSDEDTFCKKLNNFRDKEGNIYQSINLGVDAYGPSAIERKLKNQIPLLNLKLLYYFPSNGDDIDEYNFYSKMNNNLSKKLFKYQFLAAKYSYLFLAVKVTQEQLFFRFRETFIFSVESGVYKLQCISSETKDIHCPYTNFTELFDALLMDFKKPKKARVDEPPSFSDNECQKENDEHPIPDSVYDSTRNIVQLAKKNNIKLVIFLAPIDIETAYCSQKGLNHRLYNYGKTLKKFLIKENLDFIDLNEYTYLMKDSQSRLNPRPYYIIGDGHYTKIGNNWVYEIIRNKALDVLP